MGRNNILIRRYLWQIRGWLPCSGRSKRQIMKKMESILREYLLENPDVDYEKVQARFGTPQQVAIAYIDEMGTAELLGQLRIRKKVMSVFIALTAAILISWMALLMNSIITHVKNDNGYVIDRIEVIEEISYD